MQLELKVPVVVQREVDGVEMGVLADGTPFLSGAGLAKLCGTTRSVIYERAQEWEAGKRDGKLAKHLIAAGFNQPSLSVMITQRGQRGHAFDDAIAILVLEYYAYEVGNDAAKANHRLMARKSLRDFIYASTGYDPSRAVPAAWQKFHDRLVLNVVPFGYFSVFREMADVVLVAIRAGFPIDEHTVPDISVGIRWGKFWETNDLAATFGNRIKYDHCYPDYFPQAQSNPQHPWAYPIAALGVFRQWMLEEYIPKHLPGYLDGKVLKGDVTPTTAKLVTAALAPVAIAAPMPPRTLTPGPGK